MFWKTIDENKVIAFIDKVSKRFKIHHSHRDDLKSELYFEYAKIKASGKLFDNEDHFFRYFQLRANEAYRNVCLFKNQQKRRDNKITDKFIINEANLNLKTKLAKMNGGDPIDILVHNNPYEARFFV